MNDLTNDVLCLNCNFGLWQKSRKDVSATAESTLYTACYNKLVSIFLWEKTPSKGELVALASGSAPLCLDY